MGIDFFFKFFFNAGARAMEDVWFPLVCLWPSFIRLFWYLDNDSKTPFFCFCFLVLLGKKSHHPEPLSWN